MFYDVEISYEDNSLLSTAQGEIGSSRTIFIVSSSSAKPRSSLIVGNSYAAKRAEANLSFD